MSPVTERRGAPEHRTKDYDYLLEYERPIYSFNREDEHRKMVNG